jgi:HK97 family phage major capsid protein
VGASVDRFVTNPADMLALTQIKDATGSNRPLLGPDPSQQGRTTAFGVPVLTSQYVPPGIVYGLDSRRVFVVIRDDTRIETDNSVFFTSDRVAVKATMRVGFGFPHAASVVRVTKAA